MEAQCDVQADLLEIVDGAEACVARLTRERLEEQRPLLLRGMASEWVARGQWTRAWLVEHYPDVAVRVYIAASEGVLGAGPLAVPLRDLDALRAQHADVFVANQRVCDVDPALLAHVRRPLAELGGDAGNLWVGDAGHVSHLHYDAHPGVLACLVGDKRVWLWRPQRAVAVRGDAHYNAAAPVAGAGRDAILAAYGPPDVAAIDVREGDALLLPACWWHLVEARSPSTAINFWYYPLAGVAHLKWTPDAADSLWPVTQRELAAAAREWLRDGDRSKWQLLREDTMRTLYAVLARGGPDPMALYDTHRPRLVHALQALLPLL